MKSKIYCYKGFICIDSSVDAEGMINKPENGSDVFMLDLAHADIQPHVIKELKKLKHDDVRSPTIDVCYFGPNRIAFIWRGSPKKIIDPRSATVLSIFNPDVIKRTIKFQTPVKFMKMVDKTMKPI